MNWRELEVIWQRQELPRGATAEVADLLATFEAKRRKLAMTLLVRDIVEATAGLAVAVFFGVGAWRAGPGYRPMWGAVGLLLVVSGIFVRERLRARRARLGAEASLREKVAAELCELRHQSELGRRVVGWYLAPAAAALVIVVATATVNNFDHMRTKDWQFLAGYGLLCAFLFWRIRQANLRAVRTRLEPRIAEIEKLQRELFS